MGRERFVLRDEVFGGTLFDRSLLKHTFYTKAQLLLGKFQERTEISNYEHWEAECVDIRLDVPYAPTRVYFEITTGCNLRCDHCFNSSGPVGPNEMDTDEVLKCLEGLRKDHVFDVRFSGGEVTTRKNWHVEVKHAKDIGLAVSINTNGVYKDPSVVDKMAEIQPNQVTISIDGSREHHDKNRGKGTYDKSMTAMRALKEKGVVLRTNTVLTSLSIGDAEDVIRNVGEYVDEMAFFHMRMTGRASNIQERMVGFLELFEFTEKMKKIQVKYPHIRIFFGERAIQENAVMPNEFGLKIGSPDGTTRMNLLADGSVWAGGYTAYIDKGLKVGNLRNEGYSILDLWRNSPILEWYREFGRGFMMRCFDCGEFKKRCPGVNVEMELIRRVNPAVGNPNCIY